MKMKKLIYILIFMSFCIEVAAQKDSISVRLPEGLTDEIYTNEYLDTVNVKKKLFINDYSMIGVHYGVNLSQMLWNPTQKQDMLLLPNNIGVTFTKYGKMFGYMPYFGFQIGVSYSQEGYQFEHNEDKNYTYKIEGAEKAIYDLIEVPMSFHFHYDLWNFKIIGNLGCYGGYRTGIHRFPGKTGSVTPGLENSFTDYDRRWDYGIKGGIGFGLVFDPVEIHIQATYKYSFGTLYDPDYYSDIYYRYAYPSIITISAGVHFQLSKRSGKTKADLKKMAKDIVYGNEIILE